MQIDYSKLKKVLILRIGKIGDIIISSFVFRILKNLNPQLQISLVTLKKNREVLEFNPNIDRIHWIKKNIFSVSSLFKLRKEKFDAIIDLNDNPSSTSAILLKILRSEYKIGFSFSEQEKYLTIRITAPNKKTTHIIDRYVFLLQESGAKFSSAEAKPELFLNPNIESHIKEKFQNIKQTHKIVSINISAGAQIRYYPIQNWIKIINRIIEITPNVKFNLLFLNRDKKYAWEIIKEFPKEIFISTSTTNFHEFASVIKYSDLLISPDTSAIHIASATGTPVIGLYPEPEWNFVSFAPYKVKSICLRSYTEDISSINVQDVINAYQKLLEE